LSGFMIFYACSYFSDKEPGQPLALTFALARSP
jgi:hypothetical protein